MSVQYRVGSCDSSRVFLKMRSVTKQARSKLRHYRPCCASFSNLLRYTLRLCTLISKNKSLQNSSGDTRSISNFWGGRSAVVLVWFRLGWTTARASLALSTMILPTTQKSGGGSLQCVSWLVVTLEWFANAVLSSAKGSPYADLYRLIIDVMYDWSTRGTRSCSLTTARICFAWGRLWASSVIFTEVTGGAPNVMSENSMFDTNATPISSGMQITLSRLTWVWTTADEV
jgi:hypothetical protein